MSKKIEYSRPEYQKQLSRCIIKALRDLGGVASKDEIRKKLIDNGDYSYEEVYEVTKTDKNTFRKFDFPFHFGIRGMYFTGIVEEYKRGGDIVLTEKGRSIDYNLYPTKEDEENITNGWRKAIENKEKVKKNIQENNELDEIKNERKNEEWRDELLGQIKKFSPAKFEQFSRLLLSKLNIEFDKQEGIKISGDHGIDGYGFITSEELKTEKIVIQCKRYTDNPVSEPDIDKFKGVMDSYNANYGIFITTSYFTNQAKIKSRQGGRLITLVDGDKLIDLIEKYKLYIKPVTTYELDDYYYEEN